MRLAFMGAAGTGTGSKYLLEHEGKRLLVDCGPFQGLKLLRLRNWEGFPLDARKTDAVVLTHAHIDHSGYLPALAKQGFRGPVFATEATSALCGLLLPDSGHVQEADAFYANRHSFSKHHPARVLADVVSRTAARGGVVVVLAFAVGRAQALMHVLSELKRTGRIPDVPVFLNSPMATDATAIYHRFRAQHRLSREDCDRMCHVARIVNSVEESRKLNDLRVPAVIISASGMATGGRVVHHLKAFAPDRRNTILPEGYQAAGTRGAALAGGAREIKIHGEYVPVRAEVVSLGSMSAHADRGEMLGWLGRLALPPKHPWRTGRGRHPAPLYRGEAPLAVHRCRAHGGRGALMVPRKVRTSGAACLIARRAGIDTYRAPIIYMRSDCHVCRAEGFEFQARVAHGPGGGQALRRWPSRQADNAAGRRHRYCSWRSDAEDFIMCHRLAGGHGGDHLHAQTPGELEYVQAYVASQPDIVTIGGAG